MTLLERVGWFHSARKYSAPLGNVLWIAGVIFKAHRLFLLNAGNLSTFITIAACVSYVGRTTPRQILTRQAVRGQNLLSPTYLWLSGGFPIVLVSILIALVTNRTSIQLIVTTLVMIFAIGSVVYIRKMRGIAQTILRDHGGMARPGDLVKFPRSAKFVLLLVPKKNREFLLGDLEEEYQTIVLPEYGRQRANFWYWWQVLICIASLLWARIKDPLVLFLKI